MNNSLIKKESSGKFSSFLAMPNIRTMINNTLKDPKAFVTAITSAVATNPNLQKCTNESIFAAALLGASLNLPPAQQFGYFYIVPYKDRKNNVIKATFQMGYKGYIQLAIKTGLYAKINACEIKEGEMVSWNPIIEDFQSNAILDEEKREATPTVGYFAMFQLTNGFFKQIYMSKKNMEIYADKYSEAFSLETYKQVQAGTYKGETWKLSSHWYQNFDAMGKKTVLKQLISKYGPMTTEMEQAFIADDKAVKTSEDNCFDVEPITEEKQEVEAAADVPSSDLPNEDFDPLA